jgi:hypothetical protein
VKAALLELSEHRGLSAIASVRALERVDEFLEATQLGYVIMHRGRTSPALREFAIDLLNLSLIAESYDHELYVPGPPR